MATRYYTLNTATAPATLSPLALPVAVDGRLVLHPTPAQAARYDAYPRNDKALAPTPPEGKIAIPDSWEVRAGEWCRTYRYDDAPPTPPRRWSRLSIKGALADAHLLPAARAFLAAYEIKPDYPALEAFSDCNYIEEFYGGAEMWNALLDGAAQALGRTRADIDEFLDSIPVEA